MFVVSTGHRLIIRLFDKIVGTGHSTSDGQGPAHSQQIGEIPSTAYGCTEHRTVLLPLELVDWLMTVMGGTCATAH